MDLREVFRVMTGSRDQVKADDSVAGDFSSLDTQDLMKLVADIRAIQNDRKSKLKDYEEMMKDSIIQSAVELMADDATQPDIDRGVSLWVESDTKSLEKELNTWLQDVFDVEERLWTIAVNIIQNGELYLRTFFTDEGFQKDKDLQLGDYFEIRPTKAEISHLQKYGRTVGYYIKGEKTAKIHPPEDFIHFMSDRANNREDIIIKKKDGSEEEQETYQVIYGSSFLDAAREAHKIMKLIETVLLVSRISRSTLYRIFQVEVGAADRKETNKIINEIKRAINSREFMNKETNEFSSELAPMQINSNIYSPTRQGKGNMQIEEVGGRVDVKDIIDVEYFNNRRFAALKIPKAFMGFEDALPGGIGDNSLTRLDIRYARTIKTIKRVIENGMRDVINFKLRSEGKLKHIDNFKVRSARVASAEDSDKADEFQNRLRFVESIMRLLDEVYGREFDKAKIFKELLSQHLGIDSLDQYLPDQVEQESEEGDV